MKKLVTLFALILFVGVAGKVHANEGIIKLSQSENSGMSCFVTSVYIDAVYKMIGTCRGLTMAYSPENIKYVLWKMEEGGKKWVRVDEISDGKISATSGSKFEKLAVSVETPVFVRTPGGPIVAEGSMEVIPFAANIGDTSLVKTGVTIAPTKKAQPLLSVKTDQPQSGLAKVVGTIGRVVVFLFIALIIVVIVMAVVMRRKEEKLE